MDDEITISVVGKGNDFTEVLNTAGINYTKFERKPGAAYGAAGDILTIAHDAVAYVALASALATWVQARLSREITVTTKEYKIVHTKGYDAEDFEQILIVADRVSVIDTKPSGAAP